MLLKWEVRAPRNKTEHQEGRDGIKATVWTALSKGESAVKNPYLALSHFQQLETEQRKKKEREEEEMITGGSMISCALEAIKGKVSRREGVSQNYYWEAEIISISTLLSLVTWTNTALVAIWNRTAVRLLINKLEGRSRDNKVWTIPTKKCLDPNSRVEKFGGSWDDRGQEFLSYIR